jgi:hypothetical protein
MSPTTTLARLTCLSPSVNVRSSGPMSVAVVTQLVTHRLRGVAAGPRQFRRVDGAPSPRDEPVRSVGHRGPAAWTGCCPDRSMRPLVRPTPRCLPRSIAKAPQCDAMPPSGTGSRPHHCHCPDATRSGPTSSAPLANAGAAAAMSSDVLIRLSTGTLFGLGEPPPGSERKERTDDRRWHPACFSLPADRCSGG